MLRILFRILVAVVSAVVILALLFFAGSNDHDMALNLWPVPIELSAPVWATVMTFFLLGALLVFVLYTPLYLRTKSLAGRSAREAETFERELDLVRHELKVAEKKRDQDSDALKAPPAPGGRRRMPGGNFGQDGLLLGNGWGAGLIGRRHLSSSDSDAQSSSNTSSSSS